MRKSKLFLTASLLVVAIAAFAATKGMRQVRPSYYYLKAGTCVYVPTSIACQPGQASCTITDATGTFPAFASKVGNTCVTPLEQE